MNERTGPTEQGTGSESACEASTTSAIVPVPAEALSRLADLALDKGIAEREINGTRVLAVADWLVAIARELPAAPQLARVDGRAVSLYAAAPPPDGAS